MKKSLRDSLKKAGLADGEVKVYLALIDLGASTVGPIVTKSKVSSSKVYIILDKLIQKGLVSYITKNKTKYFQASHANALLEYIEEREKEILETKEGIKEVIQEIERKKTNIPSPEEARIYKGYEGLKTAFEEATKTILDKGEYFFFSVGYGDDPYLTRFFLKLVKNLKKRGVKIQGVAHKREKALYRKIYKKEYSIKFTDLQFPADTTITGDYILILVWDKKEPVVYSIASKLLVKSYTDFFKQLWKKGER